VVVSKYGYDVYGARMASTEGMATSWGFTGRRMDGAGEMYYRARYLDGTIGLFVGRDAVGLVEGLHGGNTAERFNHPYAYASVWGQIGISGPTNAIDPLGMFSYPVHNDLTYFVVYNEIVQNGFEEAEGFLLAYYSALVNFFVDISPESQLYENYRHAMSDGIRLFGTVEDKASAEAKGNALKDQTLRDAISTWCRTGDPGRSVGWLLGQGLHAVQDHIAHPNFPTWDDHILLHMGDTDDTPTLLMLQEATRDSLAYMREFTQRALHMRGR